MNQDTYIRLLEAKIEQVQHLLRTAPDLTPYDHEQADLFIELIEHSIRNTQRAACEERVGTLDDLVDLKYAIRVAGLLLQQTQEQEPKAMRGWRFSRPQNEVQRGYDFIYELALALGASIAQIEGQYPQHAAYFAWERNEYRRLCEQQDSGQKTLTN